MSDDWFENDDLFFHELQEGHRYARLVAARIEAEGIRAVVTPMRVRGHVADRHDFADESDLTVGTVRPCIIDVKSRDLDFTGPRDYPYPTALVDTVKGWEQKLHKPLAIVLVSQRTEGIAVIRVSGESRWLRQRRFDHKRRIEDVFFEVAKRELATFEEFVEWLRQRENPPPPAP